MVFIVVVAGLRIGQNLKPQIEFDMGSTWHSEEVGGNLFESPSRICRFGKHATFHQVEDELPRIVIPGNLMAWPKKQAFEQLLADPKGKAIWESKPKFSGKWNYLNLAYNLFRSLLDLVFVAAVIEVTVRVFEKSRRANPNSA